MDANSPAAKLLLKSHTLFAPIKYSLFKEVPEEKENIDLGTLARITWASVQKSLVSPELLDSSQKPLLIFVHRGII